MGTTKTNDPDGPVAHGDGGAMPSTVDQTVKAETSLGKTIIANNDCLGEATGARKGDAMFDDIRSVFVRVKLNLQ